MRTGDRVRVATILPTSANEKREAVLRNRSDVSWSIGREGVVTSDAGEGEVVQVAFPGSAVKGKAFQFFEDELELLKPETRKDD